MDNQGYDMIISFDYKKETFIQHLKKKIEEELEEEL